MLVVLLLAAGYGAWRLHYQPKRALAAYTRELRAAGEKLSVEELIPPPAPSELNGTAAFLKAISLLRRPESLLGSNPPPAMRMIAPGRAMIGWQQPEIVDPYDAKFTNSWAEVETALADVAEGMRLLEQLPEQPVLDFKLNYHQGFMLMLPNLAPMKMASQRLSAAALVDLRRGDTPAATQKIRAMLALSQGVTDERLLISQLVRIAIVAITFNAGWELLQSPDLTDDQLMEIQRGWQELEFLRSGENALLMERAMQDKTAADMRASSTGFRQIAGGGGTGWTSPGSTPDEWLEFAKETLDKAKEKSSETLWRVAWSYPDQLRALKGNQVLLETLRLARTNGCYGLAIRRQEKRLGELGFNDSDSSDDFGLLAIPDYRSILSQSVLSLHKFSNRMAIAETSRQLMVAAIALKRHHLRHGNFPADLAALTPEFLPNIPHDPMDGQPLRYRRNADGTFTLYSIGENGTDDGGDGAREKATSSPRQNFNWQYGRDRVWPQRASAEEVTACFAALVGRKNPPANPPAPPGLPPEVQAAFAARYDVASSNTPAATNPPAPRPPLNPK